MKLPKKLLCLTYQIILNEMERSGDRAAGYKEDLIELEEILCKELEKQKGRLKKMRNETAEQAKAD